MPYMLTPLAKADIFDIWAYIADDNEDAADRKRNIRRIIMERP
jgi:plasmid stabilization system protein ParE